MTTATSRCQPELTRQTVVVIGVGADIGLQTARGTRSGGAGIVLTGCNADRLKAAAAEPGALSSAAFDPADPAALGRLFGDPPDQTGRVMVTAAGPAAR
jgi:NADP-dependent 3-hydroxy acid dehydrogenase YdfG